MPDSSLQTPSHRPLKGQKSTPRTARRLRKEDADITPEYTRWAKIAGSTSGLRPQAPKEGGVGKRRASSGAKPNAPEMGYIDALVKGYLRSKGQTVGPQPQEEGAPSLQFLHDSGVPSGGMHEPGQEGVSGPGGGAGMPGGGLSGAMRGSVEPAGLAASGQNPIAPFLSQILNPRMSPASGAGAVPTLPGAPQGFSLYNMLRLIGMFKQLYGGLPVGGQSLPAGVGGARGMAGGF